MPYCPRCEQEYEPGFSVCADCDVALAPTLEAARAAKAAAAAAKEAPAAAVAPAKSGPIAEDDIETSMPEVPFYCPDARLSAALEKLLFDEQIPTFRYEAPVIVDGTTQHRIAVPPEFANYAVRLATARLGQAVVRFGRGVLLAGPAGEAEAARKHVPEDASSRIRDAEKRGDEGVPGIAAEIRGDSAVGAVELAAAALTRIDTEFSRRTALTALRDVIASGDGERAQALLTGMTAGSPWSLPADVTALLSSKDAGVRALAADAAGILQSEEALVPLVAALSDTEAGVRESAIEALFLLTGERLEFEANAEPRARAAAAAKWKAFLDSR